MADGNKIGTALDRFLLRISPRWAVSRMKHRMVAEIMLRHFEAAQGGRRTDGWRRTHADANAANWGAIPVLRAHGRDLVRNNGWAKNAVRVIPRNMVGSGIRPKAVGAKDPKAIGELWRRWAGTTECDADGRLRFGGIQALATKCVEESGEVLVRRRRRLKKDALTIPLQLQVLEPDYLDTLKNLPSSDSGGPIVQGIEFDALGRRAFYWLFDRHPGSNLLVQPVSKRVAASEVIHLYDVERAGQARGVSWLSAAVLNLKDFDEFEDAELMKAKIAAALAVFVTDVEGDPTASIGKPGTDQKTDEPLDTIIPGMVQHLKPGQDVKFVSPPSTVEGGFSTRQLRRIAASIGITYEDLTGDYSNVNFSSARMARIAHWGNILHWRENMLSPQLLDPVWAWAMEAAEFAGEIELENGELPTAEWTPPPMPLLEPDKEGLAYARLVRSGAMTPSEVARENGYDWDAFVEEYKDDLAALDKAGIILDSDARRVSQAGLEQPAGAKPANASEKDAAAA